MTWRRSFSIGGLICLVFYSIYGFGIADFTSSVDNTPSYESELILDRPDTSCPNLAATLSYYRSHGTVSFTAPNYFLCEMKTDSVHIKVHIEDCKIKMRHIWIPDKCGSSIAKYHQGRLVFFDSTDNNCKPSVLFDEGLGLKEHGRQVLPEYLRKELDSNGDVKN